MTKPEGYTEQVAGAFVNGYLAVDTKEISCEGCVVFNQTNKTHKEMLKFCTELNQKYNCGTKPVIWIQPQITYTLKNQEEKPAEKPPTEKPKKSVLEYQPGGDHYMKQGIQPVVYIHANNLGFCEGNIVKYATRWRHKGGKEDILKIIHYAELLLELEGLNKK